MSVDFCVSLFSVRCTTTAVHCYFIITDDAQASWSRVQQARVSKIERAKAAGELIRAYPSSSGELIRAYQTKNAAFVSRIERARAAGELVRASPTATVPVA